MIAGVRFGYDDERSNQLIKAVNERFRSGQVPGGVSNTFPIIRKLLPKHSFFKKEISRETQILEFFKVQHYVK